MAVAVDEAHCVVKINDKFVKNSVIFSLKVNSTTVLP